MPPTTNAAPTADLAPTGPRPLRVVIAPDSFKGSATAADVARHMADGVLAAAPDAEVRLLPMADGGEGTLDALLSVWGVEAREVATVDAIGRPRRARYGVSADGRIGVVELAAASGLPAVSDVVLQPLHAHTRGTGATCAAVLDAGVEEVVLCLGGSASTDGGAGVLTGLGARLVAHSVATVASSTDGELAGTLVPDGGEGLARVVGLDLGGLHPRAREVRWRLAVDVTNPLVGERGAAAVFGPQKGASDADVAFLDAALVRWADLLERETGVRTHDLSGAGAAGGVPAALVAVLGAELEHGATLVAQAIGLPAAVADADLVLTGEGSFDSQSVHGKVADGIGALAAAAPGRPPVVMIAGQVLLPAWQARAAGITAAFSIAPGPIDVEELVGRTASRLTEVAASVTSLYLGSVRR
ncbi:glycerate kinase [Oerskovia turbata]|uniref:Glycerate kinase n=1 Tax=Oerskovia turbata TaxID=1713 RepID=A0A4Q1KW19_9CELL|nr:glycerate kinase [Oerskovia turbata]RXR26778.1 glycerate kinase [Oerskovia turbata]RXR34511.1 glycerate kinase [Oerskovia turbata]